MGINPTPGALSVTIFFPGAPDIRDVSARVIKEVTENGCCGDGETDGGGLLGV